ncbi:MAG TPA: NosD domain-containing protein [Methanotrichaceae archaeon]|nr:NosD domain-containing protein [Methanotrichaceae archaeon]
MPSNLGKRISLLIYLTLISMLSIWAADLAGYADASNITVRSGESIQSAISSAMPGDTIQVQSGIYKGPVAVAKRLHLVGNDTGGGRPVVDAGGTGSTIALMANGCSLEGFEARNSGRSELDAGIKVSAGNITAKSNIVTRCYQGIRLQSSKGSTIEGNELSENQRGIAIFQSDENRILKNNLGGDIYGIMVWNSGGNDILENEIWTSQQIGIYLVSSQNNSITGNQLAGNALGISLILSPYNIISGNALFKNTDHGIYIKRSGGNVLKGNQMEGNTYGFFVEGQEYSDFDNYVDSRNIVDGKPIYYLVGARDTVIDASSRAGMVFCLLCSNMTIRDLETQGNDVGIYLYQTRDSVVEDNTVRDNKQYGIELLESYGNLVTCNNVTRNNKSGIYLENSSLNVIKGNNVFKNTAGMMLAESSVGNAFYLNNMALNGEYNAVDEGGNLWTLGEWGNYYQDFNCTNQDGDAVCDSGRPIAGGKNGDDRPLAGPVSFDGQKLAPTARLEGDSPSEPEFKSIFKAAVHAPAPETPKSHPQLADWEEYGQGADQENRLMALAGEVASPASHPGLADWDEYGQDASEEAAARKAAGEASQKKAQEDKWTFNRNTSYHKPPPKPLY